mmetsp:Transcript_20920/g.39316  ORF Transcript_20920/g.39316 Transcript_20920/m.39316 type:complete len:336 (-) Transcript_20920:210-1217(-)
MEVPNYVQGRHVLRLNHRYQGSGVVRVVRRHRTGLPRRLAGAVRAKLDALDGTIDQSSCGVLEILQTAARVAAAPLQDALDVQVGEVVKQSISSQDQKVTWLDGRHRHHCSLDHLICGGIVQAFEALDLHRPALVVAARLRLEDPLEAQRRQGDRAEHEHRGVAKAGGDEVGALQSRQKQSGRSELGGCRHGLLDQAHDPRLHLPAWLGLPLGGGSEEPLAARAQQLPRQRIRRQAQMMDPGHAVGNAQIIQAFQHRVGIRHSGVGLRRMLPRGKGGGKLQIGRRTGLALLSWIGHHQRLAIRQPDLLVLHELLRQASHVLVMWCGDHRLAACQQ